MANPLQMGLDTLSNLTTTRGQNIQQEGMQQAQAQVQQDQGQQAQFQQLSDQYTQTQDPAILRKMIVNNPDMARTISNELGVIDGATRSAMLNKGQAITRIIQTSPELALQKFEEMGLTNDSAFKGLLDNLQANDFEGALDEIGFAVTAIGGNALYDTFFPQEQSQTGKVAPVSFKDATAESLSEYAKTGDPGVLVRAAKYATVTIAGKEYRWNATTGEYDIPVISGESEGDADGTTTQGQLLTPKAQQEQVIQSKVAEAEALGEVKTKLTETSPAEIEKKAKQDQVKVDILSTIDELENMNISGVTGIMGRAPTFLEGSENVLIKVKRLQSMLTADNMDIMTGILSETDIKIIADLAGGIGLVTDKNGEPLRIRGSEENFYNRLEQIAEVIRNAKAKSTEQTEPEYKEGQTATHPDGGKMKYTADGWVKI